MSVNALDAAGWDEGWREVFAPHAAEGLAPARVVLEHRDGYRMVTESGERQGVLAGRLRHLALHHADLPAVGDFIAVRLGGEHDPAVVHAVLPRRTALVRQAAGERVERQVLASNVDLVFVVTTFDQDFNVRRLERYIALVWDTGATPVILLNKADVPDSDIDEHVAQATAAAAGVPVHAISALRAEGLDVLASYLQPGVTVAFVGSSGVGKSTLLNRLLGVDVQLTRATRDSDGRGRHTTTHRQLFVRPAGGIIIDTPGLRELQLGSAATGVDAVFADIETLAAGCRFADCAHLREPACAVRAAIERGELDADRFGAYQKLLAELDYAENRDALAFELERKRLGRMGSKAMRQVKERKPGA